MAGPLNNAQLEYIIQITCKLLDRDSDLWDNLESIAPLDSPMLESLVNGINNRAATSILQNIEAKVGLDIIRAPNIQILNLIKLIAEKHIGCPTTPSANLVFPDDPQSNPSISLLDGTQIAEAGRRKIDWSFKSVCECLDRLLIFQPTS